MSMASSSPGTLNTLESAWELSGGAVSMGACENGVDHVCRKRIALIYIDANKDSRLATANVSGILRCTADELCFMAFGAKCNVEEGLPCL